MSADPSSNINTTNTTREDDKKVEKQKSDNATPSLTPNAQKPEKQQLQGQNAVVSRDMFETIGKIGEGSFAKVYLVRKKGTPPGQEEELFALKQLDKVKIIKIDKVESVHRERDILMLARSHPNIIHLDCTFSDERHLYFLLEYAQNRSLAELLKLIKPLPLELTKYYTAEIISALEYIHSKGIVHRDLKPENILLDSKFHIKLTDFGDAKQFDQESLAKLFELRMTAEGLQQLILQEQENQSFSGFISGGGRGTFVGTPLYVAPEMLDSNLSGPFTDLWALGCIIYQCLTGDVPFRANYDFQVFQMIQERKLVFPKYMTVEAIDIVDRLMQLDPFARLGAGLQGSPNDYEALKSHPFLKGINFKKLQNTAPPIPYERFQAALQSIKAANQHHKYEKSCSSASNFSSNNLVGAQIDSSAFANAAAGFPAPSNPDFVVRQSNIEMEDELDDDSRESDINIPGDRELELPLRDGTSPQGDPGIVGGREGSMNEFLIQELKEDRLSKLQIPDKQKLNTQHSNIIGKQPSSQHLLVQPVQGQTGGSTKHQPLITTQQTIHSSKLEEDSQQMLVKTGIVFKKKPGIMIGVSNSVKRRLTLTNQPRLYFSNPDTGEYISDILITPFVSAIMKSGGNQDKFEILCKKSGKHYNLKVSPGEDANAWVNKITRVIDTFTK